MEALIVSRVPADAIEYDDMAAAPGAPPNASDTIRCPRLSKSKPNGSSPSEGCDRAGPGRPSAPTSNVSIVFLALSVTTSTLPPGANLTSAGPEPAIAWV